jgi:hypothetical protein
MIRDFEPTDAQTRSDEDLVADDLRRKWNLQCDRFPKSERRQGKTPDFRVYKNNQLVAYLEVKSSFDLMKYEYVGNGILESAQRGDPTYNRISSAVERAVDQFDEVNPDCTVPNVMAIVNHDSSADHIDLCAVITGRIPCESGEAFVGWRHISEGRLRQRKLRIHLFIWCDYHDEVGAQIEEHGIRRVVIHQAGSPRYRCNLHWNLGSEKCVMERLCATLDIDPKDIRPIA